MLSSVPIAHSIALTEGYPSACYNCCWQSVSFLFCCGSSATLFRAQSLSGLPRRGSGSGNLVVGNDCGGLVAESLPSPCAFLYRRHGKINKISHTAFSLAMLAFLPGTTQPSPVLCCLGRAYFEFLAHFGLSFSGFVSQKRRQTTDLIGFINEMCEFPLTRRAPVIRNSA